MKKWIALPIFWALIGLMVSNAAPTEVPFYQGTFAQMQEEARLGRVPYMVYFYVTDCEPCKKMRTQSLSHVPTGTYASQYYLNYQVDGLDFLAGIDIAKRYNVQSYPTTLIFGPDGNIRKRLEGFTTGQDLFRNLVSARENTDREVADAVAVNRNPAVSAPTESYRTMGEGLNSSPPITRGDASSNNWGSTDRTNDNTFGSNDAGKLFRGRNLDGSFRSSANTGTTDANYPYGKPREIFADYNPLAPQTQRQQDTYANNRSSASTQNSSAAAQEFNNPFAPQTPVRNTGNTGNNGSFQQNNFAPSGSRDGSFLDPVEVTYAGQSGLPDYVWQNGRQVQRYSLPADTELYMGADGQWYVAEMVDMSSTSRRMRGADMPEVEQPVTRLGAVPGFGDYAPAKIKKETYGLVINEFDAMGNLREAHKKFQEENPSIPTWVFAEKRGGAITYVLAMGAFSSPESASVDAMGRGIPDDNIHIIQLDIL